MTTTGQVPGSPSGSRPGWRDAIEADPFGLVTHREWEPLDPSHPPTAPGLAGVWRLALGLIAVLALGYAAGDGETVLLVLVLVGCVVAHEFGHYIGARTGNVKVTEFFVGFGPRVWSVRRGETEYGVKGLPLGGYCRIVGMNNLEEVDPADEARTYRQAPLWRRLLIDVAGPAANFLIAIVVLFAMFFWTGDQNYLPATSIPANNPIAQILAFSNGASPAQQAGLVAGDRIEAINGRHFASWLAMGKYIQANPGRHLNLTVDHQGRLEHLTATPVAADTVHIASGETVPTGRAGFLGIGIDPVIHSGFVASVEHAGSAAGWVTTRTLGAIGHLFTLHGASSYLHMLTSQKAADSSTNTVRFSSPIKVVQIFNQASGEGLSTVLWVIGVINVSLGLLNLLPIFPLDGGRVVVGIYEGVRGLISRRRSYRVDMAKLLPVLYLGLAFVAFLGLTSIFLDLRDAVS
jgi:membrane-associated protease RseP (regulator of RpoE activity)